MTVGIRLEVLCPDADLHRPVAVDSARQNRGVGPVDRIVRAIVICLVVEREALRLHRRQNAGEGSAIENTVRRCPGNHRVQRNECLRRGGGLGEGFLGGNTVTVDIVIPRRHLNRPHQKARWDRYCWVWNMRRSCSKLVARRGDRAAR